MRVVDIEEIRSRSYTPNKITA